MSQRGSRGEGDRSENQRQPLVGKRPFLCIVCWLPNISAKEIAYSGIALGRAAPSNG